MFYPTLERRLSRSNQKFPKRGKYQNNQNCAGLCANANRGKIEIQQSTPKHLHAPQFMPLHRCRYAKTK